MIAVSAVPTPKELQAVAVLIPTYFRLRLEEDEVVLTLLNEAFVPPRPLVTYHIQAHTDAGYGGLLLSALVEELAGQVLLQYRALRDSPTSPLLRILQIVNDPPLLANAAIAPDGALKALPKMIHTAEAEDWFPL